MLFASDFFPPFDPGLKFSKKSKISRPAEIHPVFIWAYKYSSDIENYFRPIRQNKPSRGDSVPRVDTTNSNFSVPSGGGVGVRDFQPIRRRLSRNRLSLNTLIILFTLKVVTSITLAGFSFDNLKMFHTTYWISWFEYFLKIKFKIDVFGSLI